MLAAMIFVVSMTFIDQTIVSIAVPELQRDLSLSQAGVQWIVNGYLLALSALFAFGGRLADIAGHRRMVVIGVIVFAGVAEAGIGKQRADQVADALTHSGGGDSSSFAARGGERAKEIFEAVQLDFALASRTVFYVMAGVMAVAFVIALIGLPGGKVEGAIEQPPSA